MTIALLYLLACGAPGACQNKAVHVSADFQFTRCDPTATIETTLVDGGVLVVCRCPVPAVEAPCP